MMKICAIPPILVLVLGCLGGMSLAQSVNSSVLGTVSDSSGAVVPDSDVTLRNLNTGVQQKAQTNSAGTYSFPSVPPGSYSLLVLKQGFARTEIPQFTLVVGQKATQNVTLGVATNETVTVNASSLSILQPDSNDLGSVIGPQSVAQLPLNGRNFLQLGMLSGATQAPSGAASASVNQTGHPSLSLTVAGNQPDFTMYLVDGIKTFGSRAGNTSLNISVGAIDQFEVHYGFFMPDLGPNPGIVDVITKSGTNRFHGEVYEYLRTNQMRARDYFNSAPNPPYHQNQFGGDLGGPIWKNKLFFFGNYEGYRQSQSVFTTALVPTAAMFNGDFSGITARIYNPYSYNPTTKQRTAFTDNKIPASMISPVSQKLLAYYLKPNATLGNGNNVSGSPHVTLNSDQVTFRSDLNVNDSNQIFGQFSWLNSPAVTPGLFPSQGTSFPLNTELISLGWNKTVSQTKLNELRVGWTRNSVYSQGVSIPGIQTELGITGTSDIDGVPGIGMAGYAGFGTSSGLLGDVDNVYQIHDSFSWLHGHHQIKFGGDFDYTRSVNSSANATARGSYNFTTAFSSQLATGSNGALGPVAGTGNAFADFLLGMPTNGESKGMPPFHVRWTTINPYVQDTWKMTPRLTANVGLAWFGNTPPNPSDATNKNLVHSFDFTTGLPTFAALGQTPGQLYRMTRTNFAPRIGFSYSLDDKTVIRAGFGTFYTTQMALNVQYAVVSQIITVNNSIANGQPTPTYTLGVNAFPPATVGQITPDQVAGITGAIQYLDRNIRSPYVYQWNFDVQRTFGKFLLDVGYIGNASHHLALNFNPVDCSNLGVPNDLSCNIARNPYNPKFPYIQQVSSYGWGNYNGLIVKFRRQFSNGFSLIANYTYAKALASAQQGSNSTLNQRRNCFQCDYGPTTSNVPQSLVVSAVYDLPFGRGKRFGSDMNRVLDGVVGGWNISFITTLQSGTPFSVSAPNQTVWPAANIRANRLCNGRNELTNKDVRTNGYQWIQKSCFVAPPSGFFGNGGFDILNGPGINNTDLGAHKSFTLHEDVKFTLRGEFFNAWNHAQFNNPDSGVASATFGKITSARSPRLVQIGGTITF
jgi:hypothetical protein